jgi:hypothetical protein
VTRAWHDQKVRFVAISVVVILGCPRAPADHAAIAADDATASSASTDDVAPGEVHHVLAGGLFTIPATPLEGFAEAPLVDVSASELKALGKAANEDFEKSSSAPHHTRWFFWEFDRRSLVFVLAVQEPISAPPGVLAARSRYLGKTRYRAKRTAETVAAFPGVAETIAEYEIGIGGVRAGMTLEQLYAAHGQPLRREETQLVGIDWLFYADVRVFAAYGRVENVQAWKEPP